MNTRTMALSSASSSRTPTSTARGGRWGGGDSSYYFPGCRKDANCHCEICVESFNATRDLHSALKFPPKKNSKNPPPPSAADPYTPPSTPGPVSSTAKSRQKEKPIKKYEGGWAVGRNAMLVLVGVWAFLAVDSGTLEVVLKGFGPKLGMETVREFGEEAKILERSFRGRLQVVERKVEEVVGDGKGAVCNCSSLHSVWKLNQEGHHLFFQWRCVIYQSMAEELSVWGSPLQTSGILDAGVSARSLTLLSGRITEWSEEGKLVPTSRMSNGSSWTLGKWSSAAVQLEGETWVLEYQKSALLQGPGLIQSAWEILRVRLQRVVKKLKRMLLSRNLGSSYYLNSRVRQHFEPPT